MDGQFWPTRDYRTNKHRIYVVYNESRLASYSIVIYINLPSKETKEPSIQRPTAQSRQPSKGTTPPETSAKTKGQIERELPFRVE